jgi:hypothetical protein
LLDLDSSKKQKVNNDLDLKLTAKQKKKAAKARKLGMAYEFKDDELVNTDSISRQT